MNLLNDLIEELYKKTIHIYYKHNSYIPEEFVENIVRINLKEDMYTKLKALFLDEYIKFVKDFQEYISSEMKAETYKSEYYNMTLSIKQTLPNVYKNYESKLSSANFEKELQESLLKLYQSSGVEDIYLLTDLRQTYYDFNESVKEQFTQVLKGTFEAMDSLMNDLLAKMESQLQVNNNQVEEVASEGPKKR